MKLLRLGVLPVAIALAGVMTPALAAASAGPIVIYNIFSPWDNAGLLTMYVNAPTDVTSITAHIMSGSQDMLDVSDFTLTAGTAQDGTWAVSQPIAEGQLPLGLYDVTVDVNDAGGDAQTISGVGGLNFTVHPTITLSADRADFTYLHQTAQISGKVTGLWPDGSTQPLSGVQVYVADEFGAAPLNPPIPVGTTASDGTYSGTFAPNILDQTDWPDYYYTYITATSTVSSNQSAALPLTTVTDPVTVTVAISPAQVNYGQPATISGTVTFQDGSATGPVADDTISMKDEFGVHTLTTTTDSNGNYTATLPPTVSTTWYVEAQGSDAATVTWFDIGLGHASINEAIPVTFNSFTAKLTPLGYVAVNACLSTNIPDPTVHGPNAKVTFQYAPSPHGSWRNLGSASPVYDTSSACSGSSGQLSLVSAKFPGHLINAYYRAVIKPTSQYQAEVSPVVHSWLYRSKITNMAVTPSTVSYGGKATISGRLWRQVKSGWTAGGHRRVEIIYRIAGKKTWHGLGICRANAQGWFRLRFTDGASADLEAVYLGDQTHLWTSSKIVRITLAPGAATPDRPTVPALALILPAWLRSAVASYARLSPARKAQLTG